MSTPHVKAAKAAFEKYVLSGMALVMLFLCSSPALAAVNTMQLNRVIAVVNGEVITMHDLQQQAMPEIMRRGLTGNDSLANAERNKVYAEMMDSMVMDILYKQEAERYNVIVDDGDVENELRRIIQGNNMPQEEFERQLALQGLTMDELRGKIRDGILRQRIVGLMVARKAEVSRAELEKYYNENLSRFSTHSSVEFSVIMLGAGSDPEQVYNEIASGEISFADAARKYSQFPTAAIGGRMGNIAWRDLNPAWAQILEGLEEGQTSRPVDTGGSIIMLHVDELHEGEVQSFEAVRGQIEEELRENRLQERFAEFNNQLRAKAVVDIKL